MKRRIFYEDDFQDRWDKNNYLVIPFLGQEEILELEQGFSDLVNNDSDLFFLSLWEKNFLNRKIINDFIASVYASRIHAILKDYKPMIHSYAVKKPGIKSSWHIHQDDSFTDESKFESLSFWVPLIDTNEENGTISLVEGSNLFFQDTRSSSVDKPFRNLLPLIEKKYLTSIPVKAGEALVFGHRLIHASGPNFSQDIRIATVGVYLPEEAPVLYYFKDAETDGGKVNELLLPDDFYLRFPLGEKPIGPEIRTLREVYPDTNPWTEEKWESTFQPAKNISRL